MCHCMFGVLALIADQYADITSAPPATSAPDRRQSPTGVPTLGRFDTSKQPYFHLSACRRSSRAGIRRRSRANGCLPGELRTAPSRQPQEFRKRSGNSTFTDHPLVAGSTPIRAAHMNELRDRIGGLRLAHDLPAFRWTDVPIQPGVTPVKAVHLMELRAALDQTYAAAGHSGPEYTGATVTAGVTAIRAADIMELREAVQRLESAATPPSGGRDKRRSKGARQR